MARAQKKLGITKGETAKAKFLGLPWLALTTGIFVPVAVFFLASSDTDLRLVSTQGVEVLIVESRPDGFQALFHESQTWRNHGLRPGHIDRVELRAAGYGPVPVLKAATVTKVPLRWRKPEPVKVEYSAFVNCPDDIPVGRHLPLVWKTIYFDDRGREVGWLETKLKMKRASTEGKEPGMEGSSVGVCPPKGIAS